MRSASLWLVYCLVILSRLSGVLFLPLLVAHAPLAFLLLSPMVLHLGLVANLLPLWEYYPVAIVVPALHSWVGFELGRRYGDRALQWCRRMFPSQQASLERSQRWVQASLVLSILFFPGPYLSLIVGVLGTTVRRFVPIMLVAHLIWAVICRRLGEGWEQPLSVFRQFLGQNSLTVTLLLCGAFVLWFCFRRHKN